MSALSLSKSIFLTGALGIAPLLAQTTTPGQLDTTFPTISLTPAGAHVRTAVPQLDGNLLIAGSFGTINTNTRLHAARLLAATGTFDSYHPQFNSYVNNVVVDPDGSAIYCGAFTGVNGTTVRQYVGRFASNGTLSNTFLPAVPSIANTVAKQNNNYIVASQVGLHRYLSSGNVDNTFDDYLGNTLTNAVLHTAVQPDGNILMGGPFVATTSAVNNMYFERISGFQGKVDATFKNPVLNGKVNVSSLQKDGRIIVGGAFTSVTPGGNTVLRSGLIRLLSGGTFDASFDPELSITGGGTPSVNCIATQADGKLLVGGLFTTVGHTISGTTTSYTRRGIARFNPDGTVDPTFDAKINSASYEVTSISILGDGKVLITGTFGAFNSVLRSSLVRLHNDTSSIVNDLRATDSTTVRWMRGGALPEITSATFQYSTNGTTWFPLGTGTGTRIDGGWQATTFVSLPSECQLRAFGTTTGGMYNGSVGIVSATGEYPIPVLAVAPTGGSDVPHGGTATVAPVAVGSSRNYSFDVKNTGTGDIDSFFVNITGANADQFTLISSPTPPITGPTGTAPFTVNFTPDDLGTRTATMTITSFDPELVPNSISITLQGDGVTEIEDWRYQHFGVTTDTGNAASNADPDGDGHTNELEFVAGLVPNNRASRFEQRVDASSGNAKIIFSPVVAGRTYEILTNLDLGTTWTPAVVGPPLDSGVERTFTETGAPDPKRFYRIRITKP